MKKVYYLSTCDTCKRIIKDTGIGDQFELQDIKFNAITEGQIDEMARLNGGGYEGLFSRQARKYKEMGLKDQTLNEQDYRRLIIEEYTFLKRPVVIIGNQIFIGNSPKNVASLKEAITTLKVDN